MILYSKCGDSFLFLGPRVRRNRRKLGDRCFCNGIGYGDYLTVLPSPGITANVMREDKGSPLAWPDSDLLV